MSKVTVAAIQMSCVADAAANLARAEALTREAAAKGAQIVLLPELFERPYFCQERLSTAAVPALFSFRRSASAVLCAPVFFSVSGGLCLHGPDQAGF